MTNWVALDRNKCNIAAAVKKRERGRERMEREEGERGCRGKRANKEKWWKKLWCKIVKYLSALLSHSMQRVRWLDLNNNIPLRVLLHDSTQCLQLCMLHRVNVATRTTTKNGENNKRAEIAAPHTHTHTHIGRTLDFNTLRRRFKR